jgi:Ni,Fe-hydrogenase III large subunit/Ni,Fe-hydrogenase III component G
VTKQTDPSLVEWVKREAVPEGLEFKALRENRVSVRVRAEDVEKLTERFVKKFGARMIHATGVDMEQSGFDVVYIFDFSKIKERLVIILNANLDREQPKMPSVAKVTWQACWAEKELKEFLGVDTAGMPDPRHQFLPFEWPNDVESGSKEGFVKAAKNGGGSPSSEYLLPLGVTPQQASATLIPIGPYHPGVIEGQLVRVKVEGEQVVDADIKTGFHHRGINRLIERRGYNKGVFAAERVCGICSAAHGLAYVTTVENLYDAEIPERALYIRTLLVELNRVHSHLLWIGVVADVVGWKTGFMLTWGLRERVMDIIEAITGNRINYGVWRLGGVSRDVPKELAEKANRTVLGLKEEAAKLLPDVVAHPVLKSRLVDVGPLSYPDAFDGGAVGPVARASNWKIDVRADNPPHAMYDPKKISWEVITEDGCDTYARTLVRVRELFVSMGIVSQCLEYLAKTTGEIRIKQREVEPGSEALGLNEAPRGELQYYIRAGVANLPQCVRIRTPSYRNNALLPHMLLGSALADVPVIMGSLDQCLACTDRVEVVDAKGQTKAMSWDQLVEYGKRVKGVR